MNNIVATIRIRERRGSAIGVCEEPPLLELGRSADEVAERLKHRLRDVIAADGTKQVVLVKRENSCPQEFLLLRCGHERVLRMAEAISKLGSGGPNHDARVGLRPV